MAQMTKCRRTESIRHKGHNSRKQSQYDTHAKTGEQSQSGTKDKTQENKVDVTHRPTHRRTKSTWHKEQNAGGQSQYGTQDKTQENKLNMAQKPRHIRTT